MKQRNKIFRKPLTALMVSSRFDPKQAGYFIVRILTLFRYSKSAAN
ncbi:MAG: hypothetical protein LBF88_00155 [Planctomycetaceae bacterium]|nr:hypothetical protein [Planctomycetaceae bacterium]